MRQAAGLQATANRLPAPRLDRSAVEPNGLEGHADSCLESRRERRELEPVPQRIAVSQWVHLDALEPCLP